MNNANGVAVLALWEIQYADGSYAGYRNSGETEEQAIIEWNAEKSQPYLGIEYHEEFATRGIVANIRKAKSSYRDFNLCDFYPCIKLATKAVKMQEVWMDAGYCRVPA